MLNVNKNGKKFIFVKVSDVDVNPDIFKIHIKSYTKEIEPLFVLNGSVGVHVLKKTKEIKSIHFDRFVDSSKKDKDFIMNNADSIAKTSEDIIVRLIKKRYEGVRPIKIRCEKKDVFKFYSEKNPEMASDIQAIVNFILTKI